MKTLLTVALLTLTTTTAAAQAFAPFGISFTATADDLRRMGGTLGNDGYWAIPKPPTPNPEFTAYAASVAPSGRICSIYGTGRIITTSGDGEVVKAQFNKLKTVLQTKYGSSNDYDTLSSSSIYTGTTDWMTAVQKNERNFVSFWSSSSKAVIPTGVSEIYIVVSAFDSTRGRVSVYYRTANYESCTKERDTLPRTGL